METPLNFPSSLLDGQPLRAAIAVSMRAVMRVQPLVTDAAPEAYRSGRVLELAHAFCIGVPVDLVRMELLARVPSPTPHLAHADRFRTPVEMAVLGWITFTHAVMDAAQLAFTFEHQAKIPDLNEEVRKVLAEAGKSLMCCVAASGVPTAEFALPSGSRSETDIAIAKRAFEIDLVVLGATSAKRRNWLGRPLHPTAGPLGPLWPGLEEPSWFRGGRPQSASSPAHVVAGENFDASVMPDGIQVVCWHLEGQDPVSKIVGDIQTASRTLRGEGMASPIYVVHAPGLGRRESAELVAAGATVLTDPGVEGIIPHTSSELVSVLERTAQASAAAFRSYLSSAGAPAVHAATKVPPHNLVVSDEDRKAWDGVYRQSQPRGDQNDGWPECC